MPEKSFTAAPVSFADCLRHCGPDDLILTASNRLAREFRQQLALAGRTLLPAVMPYRAWLEDNWQRLRWQAAVEGEPATETPSILTDAQEEVLWETVLRESGALQQLLFLEETVRACVSAHALLCQYRLPLEDPAWQQADECRLFLSWTHAVRARCQRQGWLLPAELPHWLSVRLQWLASVRGRNVYLAGFDEITPSQESLFVSLSAVAGSVLQVEEPVTGTAERCWLHVASDAEAEWQAAAVWARDQLARQPSARVAVVVPDLAAHHVRVAEIFQSVFHPAAASMPAASPAEDFHISFAPPLFHSALARTALHLLQVLVPAPRLAELRYLLRSPYTLGGLAEAEPRGLLEAELMGLRLDRVPHNRMRATIDEVAAALPPDTLDSCARLLRLLADAALAVQDRPERAPSAWVSMARSLFSQCLWMDASLTSAEYQLRQRLLEELAALEALDLVMPSCGLPAFLRALRSRLQQVGFQAERTHGRVLVAGMYEVTGLRFDAVWIAGMTDRILPRTLAPDPFLPAELQRACGVPRADIAQERSFATRLFQRLCRLAPQLVVSHAAREDDEQLQPSPLLRNLPDDADYPNEWLPAEEPPASPAADHWLADWDGGPFVAEGSRVRGGAGLLKHQSDCPFRAYAAARLESAGMEWESPLLERLDQGRVAHWAMEAFWKLTRNRDALVAMTDTQRQQVLAACIQQALERLRVDAADALALVQIDAEALRLQALLTQWLDEEAAREPFAVETTESPRQIPVGGARLTLRADRLDRLGDGSFALIDYKTGTADPKKWLGERPQEPQLLAYLSAEDRDVRVLAFASLKAGELGWKLFGDTPEANFKPPEGRKSNVPPQGWRDFAQESRVTIQRLIADFERGLAMVDPRDRKSACRYCDQQSFCRIAEASGTGDDTMEGDEA
ncbi:MAG: PD-(D/E)XK nuclease family protein [Bryobacterales bacterium]|jgi:probable DNA repair protein|nr:PD-(D/E)XK nuclease family protein [Bryobacterales bacterium]